MNLVQKSTPSKDYANTRKNLLANGNPYTLYSKSSWIVYVMIALLIVDQKY